MNGQNIIINNNNGNIITNYKIKKPLKKLFFTTEPKTTILVVCILSFLSQIGVYYCFYQIENNGILIAIIGSLFTWIISIPFIISCFKILNLQKYLHILYILIQSLLIVVCGARLAQYTCYCSIFKILGLDGIDPLKNIKNELFEDELVEWKYLFIHSFIGAIFLTIWMYSIRTVYNLYRRINIIKYYENNEQKIGGIKKDKGKKDSINQNKVENGQNNTKNNYNFQNISPNQMNTNYIPMVSIP